MTEGERTILMNERISLNGKAKPPHNSASAEFEVRNKALRAKTDERLDRLTELWREIEKKLIDLQQPHLAYYLYDEEEYSGFKDGHCIGIAKYAGKWRLCLGEYHEDYSWDKVSISWRPITDCTKEERISAAQYVKKLKQKIVETGEQILPRLDEAIRHLENQLADI
jgi:hypothetical protein